MNTNATQPTEIDKKLEELVAELYVPTAEGRRCIGFAAALLRAREALKQIGLKFDGKPTGQWGINTTASESLAAPELEERLG